MCVSCAYLWFSRASGHQLAKQRGPSGAILTLSDIYMFAKFLRLYAGWTCMHCTPKTPQENTFPPVMMQWRWDSSQAPKSPKETGFPSSHCSTARKDNCKIGGTETLNLGGPEPHTLKTWTLALGTQNLKARGLLLVWVSYCTNYTTTRN